jgi:hypothetical protein
VFFEGAFAPPFFPHRVPTLTAMRIYLIDPPGPFDSHEVWERHLAAVRRLPDDTLLEAEMVETAEAAVTRLRED